MTITKTTQKHQQTLRNEVRWDTTGVPATALLPVSLTRGLAQSGTPKQHPPYTLTNIFTPKKVSQVSHYPLSPTVYWPKAGTPLVSH